MTNKTETPDIDLSGVAAPAPSTTSNARVCAFDQYRHGLNATAGGLMGFSAGVKISQAAGWLAEDASVTDMALALGTTVLTTVGGSVLGTWVSKKFDVIIGLDCE
jgi:hypothetical protein